MTSPKRYNGPTIDNGKTTSTLGQDTKFVVEIDKMQANIFFDGTLNNYYNVKKADQATRDKYGGADTSYANALSNIARMWEPMGKELDDPDIGVYVQGMGTTKFKGDSLEGKALGTGETGIKQRAQAAFAPLIEKVERKRGEFGLPLILELNVFGFSRGAATARHFVHLLRNKEEQAKHFKRLWSKVIVKVNFVGLFDTVSSEGVVYGNDVEGLGLAFPNYAAVRVFHLRALDEYRDNFACTTIDSACQALSMYGNQRVTMGFELGIPGAHADVGGSYTTDYGKPTLERRRLVQGSDGYITQWGPTKVLNPPVHGPRDFAYRQGWYTGHPRETADNSGLHSRQVTGDYYKVALSLMVDMAEQYTTTRYAEKVDIVAKESTVVQVQQRLRRYLNAHAFAQRQPTQRQWALNTELGESVAKAFRHRYLHMSFNEDATGMAPRYTTTTTLERMNVPG